MPVLVRARSRAGEGDLPDLGFAGHAVVTDCSGCGGTSPHHRVGTTSVSKAPLGCAQRDSLSRRPAAFSRAVTSWQETGRVADASDSDLIRRLTDVRVHEVQKRVPPDILAGGWSWPLSSVVERITPTALRAKHLVTMVTADGPADRIGLSSRIVETYPIAALRVWGVHTRNYKNDPNDAQHVLGQLCTATGFAFPDGWGDVKPTLLDDAVDAFTCALLARTVALADGQTRPDHNANLATIEHEGWIHLPPPGHTLEALRLG